MGRRRKKFSKIFIFAKVRKYLQRYKEINQYVYNRQKLFWQENSDFLIFTVSVKLEDQQKFSIGAPIGLAHDLKWALMFREIQENIIL